MKSTIQFSKAWIKRENEKIQGYIDKYNIMMNNDILISMFTCIVLVY